MARTVDPPARIYDLAALVAPVAGPLLELERRFLAEEERLTIALGPDEPPTFGDFVDWIVMHATVAPHRPPGPDRDPEARWRRSAAQRRRRARERLESPSLERSI